jgi:hypothetical protein
MKKYLSARDAVIDLHERGFNQDFQLFGNDLLWIQEKMFVRAGDFYILEHYTFIDRFEDKRDLVVFGITAPYHNVKGILTNHYISYSLTTPPIIVKKLEEMCICFAEIAGI